MEDITAESCVQALLHGWIARYGVPGDIVTDRGAQFKSSLWQGLGRLLGIQCSNMTAYHPQANGLVERLHRQLKAALMAREQQTNWMTHLPMVLLGIRSAWRKELDCSPTELVFGTTLHLPGEFVESSPTTLPDHDFLHQLRAQMNKITPTQTAHHSTIQRANVTSRSFSCVYPTGCESSPTHSTVSRAIQSAKERRKVF